jgi:hypothetical protein
MIASLDAVTHTPTHYAAAPITVSELAIIVESKTLFRLTEQF